MQVWYEKHLGHSENSDFGAQVKAVRRMISKNIFNVTAFGYLSIAVTILLSVMYLTRTAYLHFLTADFLFFVVCFFVCVHVLFAYWATPFIFAGLARRGAALWYGAILSACLATLIAVCLRFGFAPRPNEDSVLRAAITCFFAVGIGSSCIWYFFFKKFEEGLVAALAAPERQAEEQEHSKPDQDDDETLEDQIKLLQGIRLLKAAKNYTEVHYGDRVKLLRVPLSKLAENMPISGIRIHRSYWVPEDEIERVYFVNGNAKVETKDGTHLPASRAAAKNIKQMIDTR